MRIEEDGAVGRRLAGLEPLGVVDIGSNSVRFVVYEGAIRAATPLFNEKILCGLGRTLATTGHLEKAGAARALAAMVRFHAIARVLNVKNLRAVATAAVRDAADGADFINHCEHALGVTIEILTGEREAELAAKGIRMGFMEPDGLAGDLGGGSLEVINISNDQVNDAATLPLGGLRLIDTTAGKMDRALAITDDHIATLPWIAKGRGRPFYAVGGSWRSLAKLHMHIARYPLRIMHGYTVSADSMLVFCETIRRAKRLGDIAGIAEVAKARREALPYGALVMERLIKAMNPSDVVFSVYGIREGLLFSLLPDYERRKDPLLSFCEDFAVLRSRSVDHGHELTRWTDILFTGNALAETPDENRLRLAACLISDIGWRAHPDYRGEQSLNLIAHSGLAGIDHAGRMFLALSIYFRHAEEEEAAGELSQRLRATLDKRTQRRARIVGAAVRTAHMLSIGRAGVIDECPLSVEGETLVLTLAKVYADLNGERLLRRLESLAALVGKRAEVRVAA
jgi:exopolyphosphatase / guanosine-5'-triphosphate,3'-diphosphate pyrophosphatase